MLRPSTWNRFGRRIALLTLGASLCGLGSPAAAGPIADSFKQWSMQRQTKTHVEKPFANQSGPVELNSPSVLHKLRSRLSWKPKTDSTQHHMVTEPIRLNQGTLYR